MTTARVAWLDRAVPGVVLRWEGVLTCLVAWAFLLLIPFSAGGIGLSQDALNHHIYLGWTAERHRFDRDLLAAGWQSFQSPYLYWPVYKMAVSGFHGVAAGAVLATLHVILVWPLWRVARAVAPGGTAFDVASRTLAVALGLLSSLVLSVFGSSMNDLLATAPFVWAVALAIEPVARSSGMEPRLARRHVLLSGLCVGLAVGLKLSNGLLAVWMPLLWLLCARGLRDRILAVVLGGAATLAAFALAYGPWAWVLWRHFGNPVFPFHDPWFEIVRHWVGWAAP